MSAKERLDALLPSAARSAVLDLYDELPAITPKAMLGTWRGEELATGHAFDGLLEPSGWWGKDFRALDDVDPLLFERGGKRFAGNPGLMPLGLIERAPKLARSKGGAAMFRWLLPLMKTRRPRARLRPVEYRGVTSAAMVYDQLPIIDCFRRVDDLTVLGAMDIRGFNEPYFFVLRRA